MKKSVPVPVDQPCVETQYAPEDAPPIVDAPEAPLAVTTVCVLPGVYGGLAIPRIDTAPQLFPRTFALGDYHGKAMLMAAANPSDYKPDQNGVVRIRVRHWIVLPDQRITEETGEVRDFPRTVLFDAQGKHFRTSAPHAPQRLYAAMQLFEAEEWARGIPFVISLRRGLRGRDYHDIRLDTDTQSEGG